MRNKELNEVFSYTSTTHEFNGKIYNLKKKPIKIKKRETRNPSLIFNEESDISNDVRKRDKSLKSVIHVKPYTKQIPNKKNKEEKELKIKYLIDDSIVFIFVLL